MCFAYPNCDAHVTIAYVKEAAMTEKRLALLQAELKRQLGKPGRWRTVAAPMLEVWEDDYAALQILVSCPIHQSLHALRGQLSQPDIRLPDIKRHVTATYMFHLPSEVASQIPNNLFSSQCLSDYR